MRSCAQAAFRRGGVKLLAGVVESLERRIEKERGVRRITIEAARPLTAAQRKAITSTLRPTDHISEVVRPALIAGTRILIDESEVIDSSLVQ